MAYANGLKILCKKVMHPMKREKRANFYLKSYYTARNTTRDRTAQLLIDMIYSCAQTFKPQENNKNLVFDIIIVFDILDKIAYALFFSLNNKIGVSTGWSMVI